MQSTNQNTHPTASSSSPNEQHTWREEFEKERAEYQQWMEEQKLQMQTMKKRKKYILQLVFTKFQELKTFQLIFNFC